MNANELDSRIIPESEKGLTWICASELGEGARLEPNSEVWVDGEGPGVIMEDSKTNFGPLGPDYVVWIHSDDQPVECAVSQVYFQVEIA